MNPFKVGDKVIRKPEARDPNWLAQYPNQHVHVITGIYGAVVLPLKILTDGTVDILTRRDNEQRNKQSTKRIYSQ